MRQLSEINKDIEAILKTAEKTDCKFTKASVRTCLGEVAEKLGVDILVMFPLNEKTAATDPEEFIRSILLRHPYAVAEYV